MKVLNKLNDPELGKKIVGRVKEVACRAAEKLGRQVVLMEVCGTHTTSISRMGLRSLMAGLVDLRSGPGCPVCVTDAEDIERMLLLSRIPGVEVATFGDMVRVPGKNNSLEGERARGSSVKIIYSPQDALILARETPDLEIVFLGIGFETTAPLTALTVKNAQALKLKNFSVYSAHKLVPPVMRTLLNSGNCHVDGFILPGHVSAVTGSRAFNFIGEDFGIPGIVSGFTPMDMLDSIYHLLTLILQGEHRIKNGYRWVVRDEGNKKAQKTMAECFHAGDAYWRGLGLVPESGLYWRDTYTSYDAAQKFDLKKVLPANPAGCRCGELLQGIITPWDCALFDEQCTPAHPVGPCMVSSEGACFAYYRYEGSGVRNGL